MASGDEWLAILTKLRVDRATGDPAPHKPLLLLTLIDLAEHQGLATDLLPLSPDLAYRFFAFWRVVAHRRKQKPNVRLPFHHLQSDGFWVALADTGDESSQSRDTCYAKIRPDFASSIADPTWREQARHLLIASYFQPCERLSLYQLIGIPAPSEFEVANQIAAAEKLLAEKTGREARFRINVVGAYDYTCALTGYRLTTVSAGSIVDAAHIHQFADSRNNDPRNGIALCKNAHWLFDQGFWTLTDDCQILVAKEAFAEESPDQKALTTYHGQLARLPREPSLRPGPNYLAWHRKKKFQQA